MANKDLLSLLLAKARALFHDPPNKAWVLREHEEIARRVREFVLGKASPFSSGLERRWEEAEGEG